MTSITLTEKQVEALEKLITVRLYLENWTIMDFIKEVSDLNQQSLNHYSDELISRSIDH